VLTRKPNIPDCRMFRDFSQFIHILNSTSASIHAPSNARSTRAASYSQLFTRSSAIHAAPLPLHTPVDELHLIENKDDKVARKTIDE
jgi:hypothetical protein